MKAFMTNLTKKLIAGAFVLTSLLNNGCVSIGEREFPEGHISGVEYNNLNQSKVRYKLEDQVIYDKRYYLQEVAKLPESLPMLFYPFEKTQRELDLDSGKMKLNSLEMYLPKLVEGETKGKKDKWVDGVILTSTGIRGTKAYVSSIEELSKRKDKSNSIGYKVVTTEDDAAFVLPTMKIIDEEYFVVLVEDKKINEKEKLPFYIVPVKGAKVRIDNICGNLSIYNENQVYRPVLVTESYLQEGTRTQTTFMEDLEAYQQQNPTPIPTSVPTPTPLLKKKK
jgi:hypothetical protein